MPDYGSIVMIVAVLIGSINRVFFAKGGVVLKMNGLVPRKIGVRQRNSKWCSTLDGIFLILIAIFSIDYLIDWTDHEELRRHYK